MAAVLCLLLVAVGAIPPMGAKAHVDQTLVGCVFAHTYGDVVRGSATTSPLRELPP